MDSRWNKTAPMLIHKIDWVEVRNELDITNDTLTSWRKSNDPHKHEAIDYAINKIVESKQVKSE